MKKQLKSLALIAIIAVICAAFLGCSSAGDNAAVGKWNLESVELLGQSLTADELASVSPELSDTAVEFKSDGKYNLQSGGDSETGSYKIDGNSLTLTEDALTISGEVDGSTLKLDLSEVAGVSFIATFTKA